MNVEKYLKRIGIEKIENEKGLELLSRLQYAHCTTVPYENLDLLRKKPLSLKVEDIYKKVVENGRGGYCFEVNCLFEWLLKELGFETTTYFARFWRGETGVPMKRHRIVRVDFEKESYICDVGIGSKAPRFPLKLEAETIQTQFGESYKLVKDDCFGWIIYELVKGEWQRYYSFPEIPQFDIDFEAASYYCEAHPDSKFNKTHIISLKTKEGRKTINDRDYKEFTGDEVTYIEENMSDERLEQVLWIQFGLM